MTIAYSIHQIILSATEVVEPGIAFNTENFDELLKLGAVREATKDEAALYTLTLQGITVDANIPTSDDRKALEARAIGAGVEFKANIGDVKLLERVVEAEANQRAHGDKDVQQPLV